MGFWYLVRVLKARKWVVLGVVAVTLIVIAIAAPQPKIAYEASAYMAPTPQVMRGGVISDDATSARLPNREVVLSNLIILVKGGDVFQAALDFLALPVEEQQRLAPDLPGYKYLPRIQLGPGKLLTYADWSEVLEAAPVRDPSIGEHGTTTDIIRITIRVPDDANAPYLANAVGYAFAQAFQEKSREDFRAYAKFLGSSKVQAKAELSVLRNKIATRKQSHGVAAVDAETQSAISSLAALRAQENQARTAVREAEAALGNVITQLASQPVVNRDTLPSELNPELAKLRAELSEAEAELRDLSRRYKPAHENYKAAQARVEAMRSRVAAAGRTFEMPTVNPIRADLLKKRSEAEYQLATTRAHLATVTTAVSRAQARVENLARLEPALADLMVDQALAEKRYNDLSEKHAAVITAEMESTRTGSIVPFGWARASLGPIVQGQTRLALLLYGLVLSLAVGVMAVVWLDSIDNRMRNAADVEKLLNLPVVGLTPQLTGRNGVLPKLTHLYPLSPMAESYKILRTNILFALRDTPFKTLMAAAGRPGQGATTTICNLAIALAQIGKRVVLIDADMRRPALHAFFNVPNDTGLSTLLQGTGNLADALKKTEVENLVVVPAGPRPLNPSELLGSDRMREMVERLEAHCDLVLFDAPSTVVFSDAPMLASWVDAVLMVVSANQVPRGTETRTIDLLKRANANVIGVAVNRAAPDSVDSCYFYTHYYPESAQWVPDDKLLGSGNDAEPPPAAPAAHRPQADAPRAPALKAEGKQQSEGRDEGSSPFPD